MQIKSSFRDPAGQVFEEDGKIKRRIYPSYFEEYNKFINSGLYLELVQNGLIIPHNNVIQREDYIEITPEKIPFISYPYEWCFSMLKRAALNTFMINDIALKYGMMLKDASAYNMQWYNGKMVLIDTLSFMSYEEGMNWGPYRQFLQHFVSPLLLMSSRGAAMNKLTEVYLDGIPMSLTAKLLPAIKRFSITNWPHVYAQSWNITVKGQKRMKMPRLALEALLSNLTTFTATIKYKNKSDWENYYDCDSYTPVALEDKKRIYRECLDLIKQGSLCDIGANTGDYSKLAQLFRFKVISVDSDHDCVEGCYKYSNDLLPLVVDLCNPSPAIGFGNTERQSFLDRLHVDTIMALALIHHLCIGNNIPLSMVAEMLWQHCKNLIIEFVPPDDPKAQLLRGQKNIPPYSQEIFIREFSQYFNIVRIYPINDSLRTIYLMEKL